MPSPLPPRPPHVAPDPIATAPVEVRLGLLVKVQRWIAQSLGVAFELIISKNGHVASEIVCCVRTGAVVCRHELHLTVKLLRKVHEVAVLVLAIFPDLTLALKEGELALAQSFLLSIRQWLSEIRREVRDVQRSNEQATVQMSRIIKKAASELVGSHKLVQYRERERRSKQCRSSLGVGGGGEGGRSESSQQLVKEDEGGTKKQCREEDRTGKGYHALEGGCSASHQPCGGAKGNHYSSGRGKQSLEEHQRQQRQKEEEQHEQEKEDHLTDEQILESLLPSVHCDETYPIEGEYDAKVDELAHVLNDLLPAEAVEPLRVIGETAGAMRQLEDKQISQVIVCLQRLDRILNRLDSFWERCELDLDLIIRRGEHIRNLISTAHSPDTVARLNGRLSEYAVFWGRVSLACERYLKGVSETTVATLYGFIENEEDATLPNPDGGGITAWRSGTNTDQSFASHTSLDMDQSFEGESTAGEFSGGED
eukprot:evm.model.NODE_14053_length_24851_cov_29.928293.4